MSSENKTTPVHTGNRPGLRSAGPVNTRVRSTSPLAMRPSPETSSPDASDGAATRTTRTSPSSRQVGHGGGGYPFWKHPIFSAMSYRPPAGLLGDVLLPRNAKEAWTLACNSILSLVLDHETPAEIALDLLPPLSHLQSATSRYDIVQRAASHGIDHTEVLEDILSMDSDGQLERLPCIARHLLEELTTPPEGRQPSFPIDFSGNSVPDLLGKERATAAAQTTRDPSPRRSLTESASRHEADDTAPEAAAAATHFQDATTELQKRQGTSPTPRSDAQLGPTRMWSSERPEVEEPRPTLHAPAARTLSGAGILPDAREPEPFGHRTAPVVLGPSRAPRTPHPDPTWGRFSADTSRHTAAGGPEWTIDDFLATDTQRRDARNALEALHKSLQAQKGTYDPHTADSCAKGIRTALTALFGTTGTNITKEIDNLRLAVAAVTSTVGDPSPLRQLTQGEVKVTSARLMTAFQTLVAVVAAHQWSLRRHERLGQGAITSFAVKNALGPEIFALADDADRALRSLSWRETPQPTEDFLYFAGRLTDRLKIHWREPMTTDAIGPLRALIETCETVRASCAVGLDQLDANMAKAAEEAAKGNHPAVRSAKVEEKPASPGATASKPSKPDAGTKPKAKSFKGLKALLAADIGEGPMKAGFERLDKQGFNLRKALDELGTSTDEDATAAYEKAAEALGPKFRTKYSTLKELRTAMQGFLEGGKAQA